MQRALLKSSQKRHIFLPHALTISLKMNGQDGSTDPNRRTPIHGELNLIYDWNCSSCTTPLRVTYTFGGSCTNGTTYSDQPVEWITSTQGQFDVPGSTTRIGCWIGFNVYAQGASTPQIFYFDWVR